MDRPELKAGCHNITILWKSKVGKPQNYFTNNDHLYSGLEQSGKNRHHTFSHYLFEFFFHQWKPHILHHRFWTFQFWAFHGFAGSPSVHMGFLWVVRCTSTVNRHATRASGIRTVLCQGCIQSTRANPWVGSSHMTRKKNMRLTLYVMNWPHQLWNIYLQKWVSEKISSRAEHVNFYFLYIRLPVPPNPTLNAKLLATRLRSLIFYSSAFHLKIKQVPPCTYGVNSVLIVRNPNICCKRSISLRTTAKFTHPNRQIWQTKWGNGSSDFLYSPCHLLINLRQLWKEKRCLQLNWLCFNRT